METASRVRVLDEHHGSSLSRPSRPIEPTDHGPHQNPCRVTNGTSKPHHGQQTPRRLHTATYGPPDQGFVDSRNAGARPAGGEGDVMHHVETNVPIQSYGQIAKPPLP